MSAEIVSTPLAPATTDFSRHVQTALNHGALCLMISIGHRTGLFDAMSGLPPACSTEIAARAHLHERYVREWLYAMTTARVLVLDPHTELFSLPPSHAAVLTRSAEGDTLASLAQFIGLCGRVEDEIVDCFKSGGGVPYEKFPRFQEVTAEDSAVLLTVLDSQAFPLVPELARGLADGIDVLDVGCGRGCIVHGLAARYPNSRFTGMDLSADAIAFARLAASRQGLVNARFEAIDLSDFDDTGNPESFDLVLALDAIHDQAAPLNVLAGIRRALEPGGTFIMQDICGTSHIHEDVDHPLGTFHYTISCMHCMTVSLAQGGEGLGAMWGEERARIYLARAGFASIATHRFTRDLQNTWYFCR